MLNHVNEKGPGAASGGPILEKVILRDIKCI